MRGICEAKIADAVEKSTTKIWSVLMIVYGVVPGIGGRKLREKLLRWNQLTSGPRSADCGFGLE